MGLETFIAKGLQGNRYGKSEWAGAFGDLGTLIPFLVAYISLLKMNPAGVLVSFGIAKICSGLFYQTPFPVQPMKAIGAISTTQAPQTTIISPEMVHASGLITGLIWLVLGMAGAARRVAALVGRPVALGIILGLGFSFMLDGIKLMSTAWLISGAGLLTTLALIQSRRMPAMFVLLLLGVAWAIYVSPDLWQRMVAIELNPKLPSFARSALSVQDLILGGLLLALPQLPLTLGNAVIAVTEENNRLFPAHPVTQRQVAVSTGVMNVVGSACGGVPMCHGAGGMAGHVAFGARTGGALVILGAILMFMGAFYSESVDTILSIFPQPVLGVILFITGSQLALGTCDANTLNKNDRFVMYTTAAFSVWNIGIAFVFGLAVFHLLRKRLLSI